jgi:hypothetical protein
VIPGTSSAARVGPPHRLGWLRKSRFANGALLLLPALSCRLLGPATPVGVKPECVSATYDKLGLILEKSYPDFQQRGAAHPVYFDRLELEGIFYSMYAKRTDRGTPSGAYVCSASDRKARGFGAIEGKFRDVEEFVVKMELAEGVEFLKVDRNGYLIYREVATQKILNDNEAHGL